MAKRKQHKRKVTPPVSASAKKKALRRPASIAVPRGGQGRSALQLERMLAGWWKRIGIAEYSRAQWGRLAIMAIGLCVLVYYAFSAGGYFVIRRGYGELIILLLLIAGLLFELRARGKMSQLGQIEIGLFGGYVAWTLVSVLWSIIPARSFDEFVRGILYLSGFGLAYLFMSRKEWLGWLGHLFAAIVLIVAIDALLGKAFPDLITHPDPFKSNRINYPITYWNTMALFMSMGYILGLRVLSDRRTHVAMRAVYAAGMFLYLVVLWFTVSRAVLILLALGIGIYLLLAETRLRAVMQTALLGTWAVFVVAISYMFLPNMVASIPDEGLKTGEGHKLAIAILLFMVIAAASQLAIKRMEGAVTVSKEMGRKIGYGMAAAAAIVLITGAIGFTFTGGKGGPVSFARSQLSNISSTAEAVEKPSERLFSLKTERFQEYAVSLRWFGEHPLTGTGAGTWSVAWLELRPWYIGVKDGHSWLFETMAEMGIVGTALLVGFVAMFFVVSIKDLRLLRRLGKARDRELYGAFFAICSIFLIHSMIDWDWEMPVVTLAFFMFAGCLLRYGQIIREKEAGTEQTNAAAGSRTREGWNRLLGVDVILGLGCVLAMLITFVSVVGAIKIQTAGELASSQNRDYAALEVAAKSAKKWAPLDTDPLIYEALSKQARGKPADAEKLLLEALKKEPHSDKIYRHLTNVYLQQYKAVEKNADAATKQATLDKAQEAFKNAWRANRGAIKELMDLSDQYMKLAGHYPASPFDE